MLTSRFEGLPNVLIESMAVGVPIVSTACQYGPIEMLGDSEYGVLVPVGDPPAFAAAVASLLDDPDAPARAGRARAGGARSTSIDDASAASTRSCSNGPLAGNGSSRETASDPAAPPVHDNRGVLLRDAPNLLEARAARRARRTGSSAPALRPPRHVGRELVPGQDGARRM